jgi:uncharacterized protein (TIGR02246 family)
VEVSQGKTMTNATMMMMGILLLGSGAWAEGGKPGTRPASSTDDEQAIKQLQQDFAAAWNKGDAQSLVGLYTSDGDLENPSGRMSRGRDEIAKHFEEDHARYFKGSTMAITCDNPVRFIKPDVATVDCSAVISGTTLPAAKDGTVKPTYTAVKQDGRWLIAERRVKIPVAPPPTTAKPAARAGPAVPR